MWVSLRAFEVNLVWYMSLCTEHACCHAVNVIYLNRMFISMISPVILTKDRKCWLNTGSHTAIRTECASSPSTSCKLREAYSILVCVCVCIYVCVCVCVCASVAKSNVCKPNALFTVVCAREGLCVKECLRAIQEFLVFIISGLFIQCKAFWNQHSDISTPSVRSYDAHQN